MNVIMRKKHCSYVLLYLKDYTSVRHVLPKLLGTGFRSLLSYIDCICLFHFMFWLIGNIPFMESQWVQRKSLVFPSNVRLLKRVLRNLVELKLFYLNWIHGYIFLN